MCRSRLFEWVGLALLLRGMDWIRPSLAKLTWLWGAAYGLLLWGLVEVVLTAVASPLDQNPTWECALAHLLYGLDVGYRLHTSQ